MKFKFFVLTLFLCFSIKVYSQDFDSILNRISTEIINKLNDVYLGSKKSIAILDFENSSPIALSNDLGFAFSELLTKEISRTINGNRIVERKQLDKVLNEYEIQLSSVGSLNTNIKIFELTGADILILGSVFELQDMVNVSIKVIDTFNTEILYSNSLKFDKSIFVDSTKHYSKYSQRFMFSIEDSLIENKFLLSVGFGYIYDVSKVMSLGMNIEIGTSNRKKIEKVVQDEHTEYHTYNQKFNEISFGLNILRYIKSSSSYYLLFGAGPVLTGYLDLTDIESISVSDGSTTQPKNVFGFWPLFGLKAFGSIGYEINKEVSLISQVSYQYYVETELQKSIEVVNIGPTGGVDYINIQYSNIINFNAFSFSIGVSYSF